MMDHNANLPVLPYESIPDQLVLERSNGSLRLTLPATSSWRRAFLLRLLTSIVLAAIAGTVVAVLAHAFVSSIWGLAVWAIVLGGSLPRNLWRARPAILEWTGTHLVHTDPQNGDVTRWPRERLRALVTRKWWRRFSVLAVRTTLGETIVGGYETAELLPVVDVLRCEIGLDEK